MDPFSIGPFTFYPYGCGIAIACLIGMLCMLWTAKRFTLKKGTVSLVAILALPLGVLGARLLYCLIRLPWFLSRGLHTFISFQEGGLSFYGAVAGVAFAGWIASRITGQKVGRVLDSMAVPAMLVILLSHLCMGLAQQGYGWTVGDWFSVDAFDPEEYTGMSLFHLEDASFFERLPFAIEDRFYGEYHWAVFILEAVYALIIMILLIRTQEGRKGSLAVKMLVMEAAAQVMGISMRQDSVLRWGFVRADQILSVFVFVGALIWCQHYIQEKRGFRNFLDWVCMILCMGLVMAMEFALEKKIVFLEFMPMDVCYLVMTLACIGIILSIRPAWKKASYR